MSKKFWAGFAAVVGVVCVGTIGYKTYRKFRPLTLTSAGQTFETVDVSDTDKKAEGDNRKNTDVEPVVESVLEDADGTPKTGGVVLDSIEAFGILSGSIQEEFDRIFFALVKMQGQSVSPAIGRIQLISKEGSVLISFFGDSIHSLEKTDEGIRLLTEENLTSEDQIVEKVSDLLLQAHFAISQHELSL